MLLSLSNVQVPLRISLFVRLFWVLISVASLAEGITPPYDTRWRPITSKEGLTPQQLEKAASAPPAEVACGVDSRVGFNGRDNRTSQASFNLCCLGSLAAESYRQIGGWIGSGEESLPGLVEKYCQRGRGEYVSELCCKREYWRSGRHIQRELSCEHIPGYQDVDGAKSVNWMPGNWVPGDPRTEKEDHVSIWKRWKRDVVFSIPVKNSIANQALSQSNHPYSCMIGHVIALLTSALSHVFSYMQMSLIRREEAGKRWENGDNDGVSERDLVKVDAEEKEYSLITTDLLLMTNMLIHALWETRSLSMVDLVLAGGWPFWSYIDSTNRGWVEDRENLVTNRLDIVARGAETVRREGIQYYSLFTRMMRWDLRIGDREFPERYEHREKEAESKKNGKEAVQHALTSSLADSDSEEDSEDDGPGSGSNNDSNSAHSVKSQTDSKDENQDLIVTASRLPRSVVQFFVTNFHFITYEVEKSLIAGEALSGRFLRVWMRGIRLGEIVRRGVNIGDVDKHWNDAPDPAAQGLQDSIYWCNDQPYHEKTSPWSDLPEGVSAGRVEEWILGRYGKEIHEVYSHSGLIQIATLCFAKAYNTQINEVLPAMSRSCTREGEAGDLNFKRKCLPQGTEVDPKTGRDPRTGKEPGIHKDRVFLLKKRVDLLIAHGGLALDHAMRQGSSARNVLMGLARAQTADPTLLPPLTAEDVEEFGVRWRIYEAAITNSLQFTRGGGIVERDSMGLGPYEYHLLKTLEQTWEMQHPSQGSGRAVSDPKAARRWEEAMAAGEKLPGEADTSWEWWTSYRDYGEFEESGALPFPIIAILHALSIALGSDMLAVHGRSLQPSHYYDSIANSVRLSKSPLCSDRFFQSLVGGLSNDVFWQLKEGFVGETAATPLTSLVDIGTHTGDCLLGVLQRFRLGSVGESSGATPVVAFEPSEMAVKSAKRLVFTHDAEEKCRIEGGKVVVGSIFSESEGGSSGAGSRSGETSMYSEVGYTTAQNAVTFDDKMPTVEEDETGEEGLDSETPIGTEDLDSDSGSDTKSGLLSLLWKPKARRVESVTLDDYFLGQEGQSRPQAQIGLLKMHCQGCEIDALYGGRRLIEGGQICGMVIKLSKIEDYMRGKYGFKEGEYNEGDPESRLPPGKVPLPADPSVSGSKQKWGEFLSGKIVGILGENYEMTLVSSAFHQDLWAHERIPDAKTEYTRQVVTVGSGEGVLTAGNSTALAGGLVEKPNPAGNRPLRDGFLDEEVLSYTSMVVVRREPGTAAEAHLKDSYRKCLPLVENMTRLMPPVK